VGFSRPFQSILGRPQAAITLFQQGSYVGRQPAARGGREIDNLTVAKGAQTGRVLLFESYEVH
jgi:hypothetical protein